MQEKCISIILLEKYLYEQNIKIGICGSPRWNISQTQQMLVCHYQSHTYKIWINSIHKLFIVQRGYTHTELDIPADRNFLENVFRNL